MIRRLLNEFSTSSLSIRIAVIAVVGVWTLVLGILIASAVLFLERPGQALEPTPGIATPSIALDPMVGPPGTTVTVRGEGWEAGQLVLIYLLAPGETQLPSYATAGSTADAGGQFTARFVIPSGPGWESASGGLATVVAQAAEGGASAQILFGLKSGPEEPSATPTPSVEPTDAPTEAPLAPMTTPVPGPPTATALTDLNIRGGPGTTYAVLGVLRAGQSAEITGVSADGGWWQIKFSGAADPPGGTPGRGWLSARYVTAQNTGDVPVVQAPPLPVTPTPTPTSRPVVITDWRGEYYNNRNLSGSPVLVRNDVSINFDWGSGSPGSGVPADNFSVRWTRNLNFSAGTYRFYARADDGVRLWIDGALVIDQWHDSAPTTYSADASLTQGAHDLRMEYYENSGGALAQLTWERLENYPDWKGEYYNNRKLEGRPALERNDASISFDWGSGSPGSGVPADNFSARWSRSLTFTAGNYRFYARVDDGVRLWIDGDLVIDEWHDSAVTTYSADVTLTQGVHHMRMEYYEGAGGAVAQLAWERLESYPDWKAEYYDNRKLEGNPVLVRNETEIDHNWGSNSPGSAVPADNFSARWTRRVDFKDGTYLIRVRVDDGARVWVDDTRVIDSWQDGSPRVIEVKQRISEGNHRVRVEYYERHGGALIQLSWKRQEESTNKPPKSAPGGPYAVDEGSPVALDGSGSKDPDGTIDRYEWDFNYDGRTFVVDGTGKQVETRYPDGPRTYTVALRVTDDKGGNHVATTQVQVRNVAPKAEAGGPYTGLTGSSISMAGTASDPGTIDQTGLRYRWDFGDGTKGNGPIVSHSYAQPGEYTATLTVTDKDGAQGSDTAKVQVTATNRPPTAVISGPGQGLVGETLSFDGSGSGDSDGSIASYAWSFGDGSTDTGAKVTHGYGVAGSYKVTLTVTDNGGLTASASHTVQVNEPTPINRPPTAVISAPITGVLSQTIQFDASRSRDSDGSIVSYDWDFGDESAGKGITATHVYTQAGSYQVVLTVTDDGGLAAIAKHVIQISKEGIPSEAGIQAQSRVFEAGSQPLTELRRLTLGTQR